VSVWRTIFLVVLFNSSLVAQSPATELDTAHADSLRLVGDQATNTRYLTVYPDGPDKLRERRSLYDY